jgi:hypothetical protein
VTEFANIFDYQLSAMVFSVMTIGFMAAYGLAAVWGVAQVKSDVSGAFQAA